MEHSEGGGKNDYGIYLKSTDKGMCWWAVRRGLRERRIEHNA